MPSQQEVKWSQLKVGLIVLVALVLLSTLLFLMTSASGLSVFAKKLTVYTYLANSDGLKVGAPVGLDGVSIGEVKKVEVVNDPVRKLTPVKVMLRLNPKYQDHIRKDSSVSVTTVGVLGDTVLDIDSKHATGAELEDGDELQPHVGKSINDVVDASSETLNSLNKTLAKLDVIIQNIQEGKGTAGKLITDPELYNRATATIAQMQVLVTGLNGTKGSVGKLINDPSLYDRLNDAAANLDTLTKGLNDGKGSAGKLLTDDKLYNNLNSTLSHANSLLSEADNGKGALGLLTKDPAFAAKLDSTVSELDTLLKGVNSGKGTLGKLATDDAAYGNLNKLLTSSNDLVTAVRQDPKKYLVIHLKIF